MPQTPFSLKKYTLPNRRTEEPPRSARIGIRHPNCRIQIIHIVVRDADPPPARHRRIRQIDRQDDNDRTNSQSGIQARGSDVVEAHPPAPVLVPDVFIEDEADDAPREVIERRSRWNFAAAAEDEGSGEVAERSSGESASEGVEEDGCQGTGHPEPLEVGVDGAGGEDALRADETPDDGSVEEDSTVGAVELVDLVLGADVRDGAAKCPFEDCDLDDTSPDSGNSLRHEHRPPWDLHILAELQVLNKVESLSHCDVAVCFKEHHCHWTAWLNVTSQEFPG